MIGPRARPQPFENGVAIVSDRIGRILLWLLVAMTLGAFVDGLGRIGAAGPDRVWVEVWRTFAYLVFAGLFALLAVRPRQSPGLWELTAGHKLAVVVAGLTLGDVAEAHIAMAIDTLLIVMIGSAWGLCRGWRSWSSRT